MRDKVTIPRWAAERLRGHLYYNPPVTFDGKAVHRILTAALCEGLTPDQAAKYRQREIKARSAPEPSSAKGSPPSSSPVTSHFPPLPGATP